MKKLVFIAGFLAFAYVTSCSSDSSDGPDIQQEEEETVDEVTQINDAAFEQYLVDFGFDDVVDGSVLTRNIENVEDLVLNNEGISDLTGIEDFKNLENLWANDNSLTSLDVSSNTRLKFIFVENNQLTTLDVANLTDLEKIGAANNQLTAINVLNNLALQQLTIPNNNVNAIDVANNSQLNNFSVVDNPLTCIKVSASQLGNIPAQWEKDEDDTYATTCN